MKRLPLLVLLIFCLTSAFFAQERRGGRPASTMDSSPKTFDTKDYKIRVVTLAENLVYPYCFTFLPDGSALVVESEGRLRVVRDGKLQPEAITGLPQVYFVGGQADDKFAGSFSQRSHQPAVIDRRQSGRKDFVLHLS